MTNFEAADLHATSQSLPCEAQNRVRPAVVSDNQIESFEDSIDYDGKKLATATRPSTNEFFDNRHNIEHDRLLRIYSRAALNRLFVEFSRSRNSVGRLNGSSTKTDLFVQNDNTVKDFSCQASELLKTSNHGSATRGEDTSKSHDPPQTESVVHRDPDVKNQNLHPLKTAAATLVFIGFSGIIASAIVLTIQMNIAFSAAIARHKQLQRLSTINHGGLGLDRNNNGGLIAESAI